MMTLVALDLQLSRKLIDYRDRQGCWKTFDRIFLLRVREKRMPRPLPLLSLVQAPLQTLSCGAGAATLHNAFCHSLRA